MFILASVYENELTMLKKVVNVINWIVKIGTAILAAIAAAGVLN